MNSLSYKIQKAIDTEFPGVRPGATLWQRVEAALPTGTATRRTTRIRFLPRAAAAAVLLVSLTGVGLAATPQGQAAVDWVFERFGIHLVENTPALQADLVAAGAEVTHGVAVPFEGLADRIPSGMQLPAYLPEGFEDPAVNLNNWRSGASVSFLASHTDRFVTVMYHSATFSRGSMTATAGAAEDVHELKINDRTAFAYHDDAGWSVLWPLYGHQYQVQTNTSLEEAVRVAESIR